MKVFRDALAAAHDEADDGLPHDERTWLYVPYDQLSDAIGPLSRLAPGEVGIVMVESAHKARRRPYHQTKLALLLSSQRHFALEQAGRGVVVDYRAGEAPYAEQLAAAVADRGPLTVMRPAERELRVELASLLEDGRLVEIPHEGWLTTRQQFLDGAGAEPPWRMDRFYRHIRKSTGLLMDEDGKPIGGRYSFDGDNREPWPGEPAAPEPPRFSVDAITEEVGALVRDRFGDHPGRLDLPSIAATRHQVGALWGWALQHCMPHFGPYEDAMSTKSRGLFHTRISPYLNLHRLLPRQVVDTVAGRYGVPLNSREGFVRQVFGWREFVHHVHEVTDGFRDLPEGAPPVREAPGDGGWSGWTGRDWEGAVAPDGGADPSVLDAHDPVPPVFWGTPSGLACLDTVVGRLWEDGWVHHIPRLMVLSNVATLLDLSPRDLTDWFWVGFVDAYDWVVEPNVLGMGTFSVGELMTTKPYVSGSGYVHRMSDHCADCAFHPKKTCPFTPMYWAFLSRHRDVLEGVDRARRQVWGLNRRHEVHKAWDAEVTRIVRERLAAGERITPDDLPAKPKKPKKST